MFFLVNRCGLWYKFFSCIIILSKNMNKNMKKIKIKTFVYGTMSVALSVAVSLVPMDDLLLGALVMVALVVLMLIFANKCAQGYCQLRGCAQKAYDAVYWGLSAVLLAMYTVKICFLTSYIWLVTAVATVIYLVVSVRAYKKIGEWETL